MLASVAGSADDCRYTHIGGIKMDDFNVYCSDWLTGFGRFVVITTSQYDTNGKDITSEAFVFGLDSAPTIKRFTGQLIHYEDNPEARDVVNVDLLFMEEEAQRQARNMIYEYQYEEYTKTNRSELIDSGYKLLPCNKNILITLKVSGNYEAELQSIANDTRSSGLRDFISRILSFPKLDIRKIK
jgi:hypothetical protein